MTSKTATCGAQYSYFIYQSWWNVLFVMIFDFKWWLFFCNSINMEWNWPRISTGHEASKKKWLVKILAKFRYYFEGEEKMSRPFPSWLGFKSRCSYHDKLLCGLKQYCLVWLCWGKVPWEWQPSPSCCTESCVIVQLFAFTVAFWKYRGQQEPLLLLPRVWLLWISRPGR